VSRAVLTRTLRVAEQVAAATEAEGGRVAVIGAMACAAWNYPRHTRDFDLGTDLDPATAFPGICRRLRALGLTVEERLPDVDDPLGGLLRIEKRGLRPIELINFYNPLRPRRNPGRRAVERALPERLVPSSLRLVDLPDLIALKLYAGGPKSTLDILELLERNPELDLDEVTETARAAGLSAELSRVLDLR
jgi:hypothetical protein